MNSGYSELKSKFRLLSHPHSTRSTSVKASIYAKLVRE